MRRQLSRSLTRRSFICLYRSNSDSSDSEVTKWVSVEVNATGKEWPAPGLTYAPQHRFSCPSLQSRLLLRKVYTVVSSSSDGRALSAELSRHIRLYMTYLIQLVHAGFALSHSRDV